MKVKDLTKPSSMSGEQAHTLVKDLLSATPTKGKVNSIKLKIKFNGSKEKKSKKRRQSHNPTSNW